VNSPASWPGLTPDGQPHGHAFGGPPVEGVVRAAPEDFVVDEQLGFVPSGAGEHVMLWVEKRDANTTWVAGRLATLAGVARRDVGYAGLKDRFAVTRQWFSVGLAGRPEPDWSALGAEGVQVLEAVRHHRKLRRGALTGNRFRLRVRELAGATEQAVQTLGEIARRGFPNLFGPQRFGHQGRNLDAARRLLDGTLRRVKREQRSIYLSAARSLLFNAVAAARIDDGSWERALDGEPLVLDGRRSFFICDIADPELPDRLETLEIHPSGPLWGRGDAAIERAAAVFEHGLLEPFVNWREGLERLGLEAGRRALRVRAADLAWSLEDGVLELEFELPAGSYATSLLREVVVVSGPGRD